MIVGALVAVLTVCMVYYASGDAVSPDGVKYLRSAAGGSVPVPFHLRRLLPRLLGKSVVAWRVCSWGSLVVLSVCVGEIARCYGMSFQSSVLASVLVCGLPIFRTSVFFPVLVDAPALALTSLSVLLVMNGEVLFAVLVVMVGAAVKEHVPVFSFLACMCPWLLLGLLVPIILRYTGEPARGEYPGELHPFQFARTFHAKEVFSAKHHVLPWGVCATAAFSPPTLGLCLSLVVSYGMLLVASDSTRVYQWALIPMCIAASSVVPEWLVIPAAVSHTFWPVRGRI